MLGSAHTGAGGTAKTVVLQVVETSPCPFDPDGVGICGYKGNLVPAVQDYSATEISSLNATSQNFLTSYRAPFFEVEVHMTPLTAIAPRRIYGCGLSEFRFSWTP